MKTPKGETRHAVLPRYEKLIASMSRRKAFGYVRDLSGIGNRWLGSRGETRARQYIISKFKRFGLEDVHTEDFQYIRYTPKKARLEIVHPLKLTLECKPLEYSHNGTIEAEVVYAGEGTEAEFNRLEKIGVSFKGKIVAVSSFAPFLISPLCKSRRVAGMIVISDAPGNYIRGLVAKLDIKNVNPKPPLDKYLVSFPGATTSIAGGEKLLSLLSVGKVMARITHQASFTKSTTSNVVGIVKGVVEPEKKVIIGGHYDSQIAGSFAWDNGCGVAAVMEMARVVAGRRPRRTVVFIAFSAEEIGLLGAAAYAQAHKADLSKNAVAMINLDAVGSVFPAENTIWATKDIEKLALEKAKEAEWKVGPVVDPSAFVFSDYYPFMVLGIPSTWIWEYPPIHPYYHSEKDVLEYVDAKKLIKAIEVNARLAFHLAFADKLNKLGQKR